VTSPTPGTVGSATSRFRAARVAITAAAAAVAAGAATGCMVGPNYKVPPTPAPADYGESHPGPTTKASQPVDLAVWWRTFNDPELNSLITRAIAGNNTFLQAQARVRQARAQLGVEWGNEFPTLDLDGGYTRTQTSRAAKGVSTATSSGNTTSGSGTTTTTGGSTTGTGTTGTTTTGGTGSSTAGSASSLTSGLTKRQVDLYQAGFDAGWEIDVFGGNRRAIEAAEDDLEVQVDARRNALVTLTSEVARDYVTLRGDQLQLGYANSNLASEKSTLELTRSRFRAGLTSDLDVANAEASVAETAATVPTLEISIKQQIHAISILLGLEPMALASELGRDAPIPVTPSEVPVGLPSELLRRRPDVRQAERQLAENTANVGVAVAQLFPKFSLTGSVGQESTRFGLIARDASTIWSFGPTMEWQILSYTQLQSEVRVTNAEQAQALYAYHQTVLQSFGDVEDALIAYAQDQVRTKALQDEVSANQRAVDLSTQLYTRGLGDFLNVLTAQRALFAAQNDLAISQSNVATDLVQLYKALGGGWDEKDERPYQKNENPGLPITNGVPGERVTG
jgi:multidrug efflux system outer membrane protein